MSLLVKIQRLPAQEIELQFLLYLQAFFFGNLNNTQIKQFHDNIVDMQNKENY